MVSDTDRLLSDARSLRLSHLVVGVVLFVLFLSGPLGGVDFTGETAQLGEGNASVTVVEPTTETLHVTQGRFGTQAVYLRIPDLVATVQSVDGRPRIVYELRVPALDVEKRQTRLVNSPGRMRVPMADQAFERASSGTYDGSLTVRVQSFSGDWTVTNRSLEVQVP